jgi:hypothetical protein
MPEEQKPAAPEPHRVSFGFTVPTEWLASVRHEAPLLLDIVTVRTIPELRGAIAEGKPRILFPLLPVDDWKNSSLKNVWSIVKLILCLHL